MLMLPRAFDIMDEDEDGYISEAEADEAWPSHRVWDVIQMLDMDGDGKVDFGEYHAYFETW